MDYTLIRQNRKTLAIYVRMSGLEVRAPLHISKAQIDGFVEQKRGLIEKQLAEMQTKSKIKSAFEVNYGSRISYRGIQYIVGGVPGKRVFFDGAFCVPVNLTPERIKCLCIQIYRMLAKRDLFEKNQKYADQMGVCPSGVKINGAKTRWGSCSAKKSINFSWRLMMADDEVIDYVVVHELAHIREMNHSPRFWAIVQDVLPDYKQRRARLKELQDKLSAEDWD